MSSVSKIAPKTIQNRRRTPFFSWLRDKLLAVDRDPKTPPPGLPTADGKARHYNPLRFPNTQASRAIEMPKLPEGVHHRLSNVYYFERDARREVKPPAPLYKPSNDGEGVFTDLTGKPLPHEEVEKLVMKGPEKNFGIPKAPTPGFGHNWSRSIEAEQETQKNDPHLKHVERYDHYLKT
ncbi:Complex I-B14.5a [Aphelenchoides besseyi]|nr:Complex I-B14.5a [Aphelenchoides besseyi]KAI6227871.1 Complex I-B14.5a [Aphelenchoides besseyi]